MRIKRRNLYSEADGRWAGSRETTSIPVEAELFFLTSLFIELIERTGGVESAISLAGDL